MNDNAWKYTAAERRQINAAFDEVARMMDATGHSEPHRLRDALRIERRERQDVTLAKALIVRGFAEGMDTDPRASSLMCYSEGIATAVILGADHGRRRRGGVVGLFDPTPADRDLLPRLIAEASSAHNAYMGRGLRGIAGTGPRTSTRRAT